MTASRAGTTLVSPLRVLALGGWLGVAYGVIEGIVIGILLFVPGALTWQGGNTADILWAAPAVYGVSGLLLAVPFALLAALVRRVEWDAALVALLVGLGAYFLVRIRGGAGLEWWGILALAAGLAVTAWRVYRPRRDRWSARALRTAPAMALVPLAMFGGVRGTRRVRESRALGALPAPPDGAPNVLLLVIDTQRADHLGAYGYERNTSPGLDRLAKSSLLFENAASSSSWTLPAHSSMFTGHELHEHRAGMINRRFLDDRLPTIAEAMSKAGYATGSAVGNTHFAGRQTGLQRGFLRYGDFYGTPGDAIGRTAFGNLLTWTILPKLGWIDLLGRKRASTVNREILSFVESAGGRPWFVFANYFDVHRPVLPPKPFAGKFSRAGVADDAEGKGQLQFGWLNGDVRVPSEAKLQAMRDSYDDGVAYVDASIDSLLAELDRRGVLRNTAVIVTSDHGESWGEHGLMFHGHSLYMHQVHVPLIVHFPRRVPEGRRVARAAGIQQIPATVLDLAGVRDARFPGRSLLATAAEDAGAHSAAGVAAHADGEAGEAEPAGPAISEVARNSRNRFNWPSSKTALGAALTERWHFIYPLAGAPELYDIRRDPRELVNLADSSAYGAVVDSLRGALERSGVRKLDIPNRKQ